MWDSTAQLSLQPQTHSSAPPSLGLAHSTPTGAIRQPLRACVLQLIAVAWTRVVASPTSSQQQQQQQQGWSGSSVSQWRCC